MVLTYIHTYIRTCIHIFIHAYIWDITDVCSNSIFVSMLKHFKTIMANTFKATVIGNRKQPTMCAHVHGHAPALCMYICMYVCIYVRTCVCTYICMYVCMYACIHTNILPNIPDRTIGLNPRNKI